MAKNLLDFDRADLIGTKVLLGLITIAVTIYALIMPLVDWIRAKAFVAEVPALAGMDVDSAGLKLRSGASILETTAMRVSIEDPSTTLRLLDLAAGVVLVTATALVAWHVLRVLNQIVAGDPFAGAVVTWLRVIAFTLILAPGVYLPLVLARHGAVIGETVDTRKASIEIPFSLDLFGPMVVGLVIAAFALAFDHGGRLREDAEGLI
jgi:hypothetical protein